LRHKVYGEPGSARTQPQPSTPKVGYEPSYLAEHASALAHLSDGKLPDWLEERSQFTCFNRSPAGVIHKLHHQGEAAVILTCLESKLECVFVHDGPQQDLSELDYLRRGQPLGVWWLPNPCNGRLISLERLQGLTARSLENVTAWRYVLLESDCGELWDFVRAVACFDCFPIVSICLSGKRSAHALGRLDATSLEDWHAKLAPYRDHLLRLGCCQGSLTPLRATRLPNCMRKETGQLQKLLYLTPDADLTPIFKRPVHQSLTAINRRVEAARFETGDANYQ
jgi:hypothetical protein